MLGLAVVVSARAVAVGGACAASVAVAARCGAALKAAYQEQCGGDDDYRHDDDLRCHGLYSFLILSRSLAGVKSAGYCSKLRRKGQPEAYREQP